MVGELSQYHKETVRYTKDSSYITINNPFTVDFKYASIKCSVDPARSGSIIMMQMGDEIGGQFSHNWSTGADNYTIMKKVVKTGYPSNNEIVIRDGTIIFGRPGGSYFWAKDTDYTVELYA